MYDTRERSRLSLPVPHPSSCFDYRYTTDSVTSAAVYIALQSNTVSVFVCSVLHVIPILLLVFII